jgi:hypothetical protein
MKTLSRRTLFALAAVIGLGSASLVRADYPTFMNSMFPQSRPAPMQKLPTPAKQFRPQRFTGTGPGKLQDFQLQQTMSHSNQNQTLAGSILKKQQEANKQINKKL